MSGDSTYSDMIGSGGQSVGAIAQNQYMVGMDFAVHAKPKSTFWRHKTTPYAQFSMENTLYSFRNAQWGIWNTVTVPKSMDLIYLAALRYVRPALKTEWHDRAVTPNFPSYVNECKRCTETERELMSSLSGKDKSVSSGLDKFLAKNSINPEGRGTFEIETEDKEEENPQENMWAHWVNDFATVATKCVKMVLLDQVVDSITSLNMYVWDQLAVSASQRSGWDEMVGHADCREDLIADSKRERVLYRELPFWHTTPQKAYTMIAGLYTKCEYQVKFARIEECIVRSHPNVKVLDYNTGNPIETTKMDVSLDLTNVFLQTAERDRFGLTPYDVVIHCHEQYDFEINSRNGNGRKFKFHVPTPHLVSEINWVFRRRCNIEANDHFNTSGLNGDDPMFSASIDFANAPRHVTREAAFWRLRQNQFHTSIPSDAFIYTYTFCLEPESDNVTGGASMSRFDGFTLNVTVQEGLQYESVILSIMVRVINLLKHREGAIGTAFGVKHQ